MLYSDSDIRKALADGLFEIDGMVEGSLQPASVDFHLSDRPFKHWGNQGDAITPWIDQSAEMVEQHPGTRWDEGDGLFVLDRGEFALASTVERVRIGNIVAGRLEGKSSLARLGLVIHTTAGFFDPGFEGYPTLELVNLSPRPMLLRPGMPIAQMSFFELKSLCVNPYDVKGHYTGQGADPEPSHYFENFQDEEQPDG